ncbi:MAG: hypothetical protein Q7R52_03560 [archaeon]|nr:hypothetical protein [archaeon]
MDEEKLLSKKEMEFIIGEDGFKRYYEKIIKILKEYMDIEEQYYSVISIWIIGTYIHKQFPAYPYLFFNAMRGSGKTRMLKIIASLSKNGKVAGCMTEAVLFRTAKNRTLCIDEFESLNAKGNENLKLLLNSAYKKGTTIERLTKRKTKEGEQQIVEEFEVYCPVAMANIWGMENVLSDRCIGIILEKSSKIKITKLIENFENNSRFQEVRGGLKRLTDNIREDSDIFGDVFNKWNFYQKNVVNEVNNVSNVNEVNNVSNFDDIYDIDDLYNIFQKINNTNLSGRDLELFFPVFIIADIIREDVLNSCLETAKRIVQEKRQSDREENKDVKMIEFIAQSNLEGYQDVSKIVKDFQEFLGEEEKWINSRGISRGLKRLGLILDRKNTGKLRQVKLNILKAQEKLLMFKNPDEIKKLNFSDEEIKQAGYEPEEIRKLQEEK